MPFVVRDHACAPILAIAGTTVKGRRNFLHFDKLCYDPPDLQTLEEWYKGDVDGDGSAKDDSFVWYTDGVLDLLRPYVLHGLEPISIENDLAIHHVSSPLH